MLSSKVFQSGLSTLAVASICNDVGSSLTAAGTTQGTATALINSLNVFTTVASGSGAVLLSTAIAGDSQLVYNGGANALKVYPDTGASVNGLPANTGVLVAKSTACEFHRATSTQWIAILSA